MHYNALDAPSGGGCRAKSAKGLLSMVALAFISWTSRRFMRYESASLSDANDSGVFKSTAAHPGDGPLVPFRPRTGSVDDVLLKPSPPNLLQALPPGLADGVHCLFVYTGPTDELTGSRNGAEKEIAYIYGAAQSLPERPAGPASGARLARVTGRPGDVLQGDVVCCPGDVFTSVLARADAHYHFQPSRPEQGSVRRGVVKAVCADGAVKSSVWYYQGSKSASTGLAGTSERFEEFSAFVLKLQQEIIAQLEEVDKTVKFQRDPWQRESGFGLTAVVQGGEFLEKGAVSTTITTGKLSKERAESISARNKDFVLAVGSPFYAAALSLVLHSRSPNVPTFRSDVRYFEVGNKTGWFGGGADLTPYYLFDEDAIFFHKLYQGLVDTKGGSGTYAKFKKWCDDYFYLPARQEHRGIGGIFFDDLSSTNRSPHVDAAMALTIAVAQNFMPSYLPIVKKRRHLPYTEEQRHWQLLRRGRYIEFNLLYDRGVKFGLVPGGRIEAVMVSCPPLVAWDYNHVPTAGSEEARLMDILKKPCEWA
eukprot:g69283.t1